MSQNEGFPESSAFLLYFLGGRLLFFKNIHTTTAQSQKVWQYDHSGVYLEQWMVQWNVHIDHCL